MRQAFAWAFFKASNLGRRTPSTPKPGHIALSPHRAGCADEPFVGCSKNAEGFIMERAASKIIFSVPGLMLFLLRQYT